MQKEPNPNLRRVLIRKMASAAERLARKTGALLDEDQWSNHELRQGRPSMTWSLRALRDRGFSPKSVIDIGAFHGDWAVLCRKTFPRAPVLMIEARPSEAERLRAVCAADAAIDMRVALLGAESKAQVPFHELALGGSGSSVLTERSDVPGQVLHLPMTTLDDLVRDTDFCTPGLLKLDVQGYELEVLRGGSRCLESAEVLVLEVGCWPLNEGAPLLHEVVSWLAERDFVTYDVAALMRRPEDHVLLQMDMLFVSRRSPLWDGSITKFMREAAR